MTAFPIPVVALGPGSQPGEPVPDYLPLPQGMHTFQSPSLPEPEETRHLTAARALLGRLLDQLEHHLDSGGPTSPLDLGHLDPANLALVHQALGEGEVSARVDLPEGRLRIQESVFAGVWRVRLLDADGQPLADRLEVGDVPAAVRAAGRLGRAGELTWPAPPQGVVNAPALLAEIAEQASQAGRSNDQPHVINLTLLPFSPDDAAHLDQALGRGRVTLLSRGYGNCRITATGVARVWWVQYFNAQDALILNTLEVTDLPEVARAAREDLEDSQERLAEVLAWIG